MTFLSNSINAPQGIDTPTQNIMISIVERLATTMY